MKRIYYGFICSALMLTAASCNDDNPWQYSEGEGGIAPQVSTDSHVRDAIPTRAQAMAPDASQFGLKLSKTDGTSSYQWNTVAEFPEDKGFPAGEYTLEAYYGNADDEGYNKPYYRGVTSLTVKPGETTEASVTATLANTMVDVKYTEAFRNYFSQYTTTLHSEGYGYHELSSTVDDPIYLVPGTVKVTVAFTKQNGTSATIQPAEFVAEARHYYHITLDVNNGEIGDAQLVVKFDDTVQTEDVEIDLSDELLNLAAPEVTAKGFTPGTAVSILESAKYQGEAKFAAYAAGTITSAVLTIESDNYTAPFGREVELANASESLQQQLAAEGIRCIGLFKNPAELASVDIAGLLARLPQGEHRITLVVKDKLTRVNDPVTFVAQCTALVVNLVSTEISPVGSTVGNIIVAYNGSDLANDITVKGLDDSGVWVDCPITAVSQASGKRAATRSDAFPTRNYNVRLAVPNTTRDLSIKLYYHGKEMAAGTIAKAAPNYTLTANTFARRTVIKVSGTDSKALNEFITENVRLFAGGSEIPASNITRNASTGEITIRGLDPSTTYHITSTAMKGSNPTMGAELRITTEAAAQPLNAGMEEWYSSKVYSGSTFSEDIYRWFPMASASATPYWTTRNATTTSQTSGATPYYTSYSGTYPVNGASGKAAEICTEGWGYGVTYSDVTDPSVAIATPGMLFMGEHSYSGPGNKKEFQADKEVFNYGRAFTSRPTSLSFDYKFAPVNNESFKAYVVIENRDGGKTTELARAELVSGTAQSAFTNTTLNLKYTNQSLKATHAYIVFISSTADSPKLTKRQGSKGAFKGYSDSRYVGSVLTVDNIQFNY